MADINNEADDDASATLNNTSNVTMLPSSSPILTDDSNEIMYTDSIRKTPPDIPSEHNINEEEIRKIEEISAAREQSIEIKLNTRALPINALTYQLEEFQKNAMIIFNHENVEGYLPRKGTIEDEKALRDTFSKFGFEIEPPHIDFTKVQLFDALKTFSEKDFTHYGCVVIVVMTHGSRDGLLRAKDEGQLYSEQDIINHFKAQRKPTLVTKPVILIIQACRGKSSSRSVAVMQMTSIFKDHDEEFTPYHLPVESDMLIFHSSYTGKISFRPESGSWFIQTLCKRINELYGTHDLESIFIEVKREVAIKKYHMERNRITQEMDVYKQMPVVTSTLIRKLYLKSNNDMLPLPSGIRRSAGETSADSDHLRPKDSTCDCILQHFAYMKTCLSYIVRNNPKDEIARDLLAISRCTNAVNDAKTRFTLKLISNYLRKHYKGSEFHKYIYFYESGCDTSIEQIAKAHHSCLTFTNKWEDCNKSFLILSFAICLGAYVIYNLFNFI